MSDSRKAFFFHYNKPASQKAKKPQISIHYKGTCYLVNNLICNVITKGKIRKQQPFFIMVGKCENFEIIDGVGILS